MCAIITYSFETKRSGREFCSSEFENIPNFFTLKISFYMGVKNKMYVEQ